MSYSESEPDTNFAIHSVKNFDSSSEPNSESDFSSVFMNLDICILFILYLHSLNKPAYGFFYLFS